MINTLVKEYLPKKATDRAPIYDVTVFLLCFFLLEDVLALIVAAYFAYTVCKDVLAAVRALYHAGHVKLPYV